MNTPPTRISQIALSVSDREASRNFYGRVMGLRYANQTDSFKGKAAEAVQGIPGVSSLVAWMIDDRDFMQLELFQFLTPETRPFAHTRRPWDVGYSRVAFEVNDVAAFHQECKTEAVSRLSPIVEIAGRPYFSMADPNGILLEIGQAENRLPEGLKTRACGIALTVPDMQSALVNFRDTLGFEMLDRNPVDKGMLWGEKEAEKKIRLLNGDTLWVEISAYETPESKPWPEGYRISDVGIVNIAVGFRDIKGIRAMYQRAVSGGYTPNCEPRCTPGFGGVTYVNDTQGFSVEIMALYRWLDGALGFRAANRFDRMLAALLAKIS